MSQTGRPAYSLRSAVRAGQASPPPGFWSPGAVSPTTGTPGTDRASAAMPKSRSVSPELLYSEVVSHRPTLRKEGGISHSGSPSAVVSSGNVPDEPSVPALNPDVDWGLLDNHHAPRSDHDGNSATANAHRARSPVNNSQNSMSTLSQALHEMSATELLAVARRYQSMAQEALDVATEREQAPLPCENISLIDIDDSEPSPDAKIVSSTSESPAISVGEGPSRKKGKGIDPRNWGNVDFSEEFTDGDFEAQRDALENFAEINRVIKREQFTTPPGFFDEPDVVRTSSRRSSKQSKDSKVSSQKIEPKVPGQDTKERIAKLRRELSILEQTERLNLSQKSSLP
ncbi:hypothetical protein B0H13DRAFT_2282790 [Mycena leptocephala]|nr:hypothetical protein B0H13DRAFT_2282790 [Mycena leptocephala]